jgi:hypothetical protein
MKTPKLITAIIAIFLFSNLLFAGNPNPETPDDISNNMVEFVHNDVKLTPAQKVTLKKKAKEYADKLVQARAMDDKDASYAFMKTVSENYQTAMDSILTPDQKVAKDKKFKDRIDEIVRNANANLNK